MIMRKILLLLMLIMVVIVVISCGNAEQPQIGHPMPPPPPHLVPFIGVSVDMPMEYSEITSEGITITLENIHGFDLYRGYIRWGLYKYDNGGRYVQQSESEDALTYSLQNDESWIRLTTGVMTWPGMEIAQERRQAGIRTAFFEYRTQMELRISWFEDSEEELLPGLYRFNLSSEALPQTMRWDHIHPGLRQNDRWDVRFEIELAELQGGYDETYPSVRCPCGEFYMHEVLRTPTPPINIREPYEIGFGYLPQFEQFLDQFETIHEIILVRGGMTFVIWTDEPLRDFYFASLDVDGLYWGEGGRIVIDTREVIFEIDELLPGEAFVFSVLFAQYLRPNAGIGFTDSNGVHRRMFIFGPSMRGGCYPLFALSPLGDSGWAVWR